ncbi:MAG: hypothetical protein DYG92_13335 [Leptolyngbya sp. PLA1]|nr:hypothetical protein [Leptolyngbya sp. PLA1]
MNAKNQPLEPQRLVDAAIVVLKVCTAYASAHDGRSVHPTELMGDAAEGRELAVFTRHEVEEATRFLVRLGYLEAVGQSGA